ncbi:MAG: hypothetical protein AAF471_04520 [Myxococcota bacterium]
MARSGPATRTGKPGCSQIVNPKSTGRKPDTLSFAREMLRGGFSVTTLAELTALPAQVIDELKDERPAIKYSITEKGRRYLDQLGL